EMDVVLDGGRLTTASGYGPWPSVLRWVLYGSTPVCDRFEEAEKLLRTRSRQVLRGTASLVCRGALQVPSHEPDQLRQRFAVVAAVVATGRGGGVLRVRPADELPRPFDEPVVRPAPDSDGDVAQGVDVPQR